MKYVCKKCGSVDVIAKEKGDHFGLWCADCGKWIKWLGKDEKEKFIKRNGKYDIKTRLTEIRNEINDILDEL